MKRYIFLSAMLVIALNLCAQESNTGRATRQRSNAGSAVKENKSSETSSKAEVKKERAEERKAVRIFTPSKEPETRTITRTRSVNRANTSNENRSNPSVSSERTRERTITREREINPGNNRNNISPAQDRNTRKVERSVERTVTRERPATPERTITTRRSGSTVSRPEYIPRDEREFAERRRAYSTPERRVVVRTVRYPNHVHRPVEYRRTYYPYRVPVHLDIYWDIHLFHKYRYLYPHYDYWYYPIGYRIHTVSAYDADRYIGEFARIYGRVSETWYSNETDEVYLYFGEPYPYQDFTVILAGREARRISRRPERFFTGRDVAVLGVVSVFEGKPEMVVKDRSQIDLHF